MRWLLALLVLGGCAERVNTVQLVVPENPVGLSCRDSTTMQHLLRREPIDDGFVDASLVLDYLNFDGVPSCRARQLLRACATTAGCPIVRRDCVHLRFPVSTEPGEEPSLAELTTMFGQELAAMGPITHDAPDGIVSVRAVLTTHTCQEVERTGRTFPLMSCDSLLGCLYSCPVRLDDVSGDVELELDALADTCTEAEVEICAGIGNGPVGCTR